MLFSVLLCALSPLGRLSRAAYFGFIGVMLIAQLYLGVVLFAFSSLPFMFDFAFHAMLCIEVLLLIPFCMATTNRVRDAGGQAYIPIGFFITSTVVIVLEVYSSPALSYLLSNWSGKGITMMYMSCVGFSISTAIFVLLPSYLNRHDLSIFKTIAR